MKTDTVFVDATRVVTDAGRISLFLWVDVMRGDGGEVLTGEPARLWVELEWEKTGGEAESLRMYEETVPAEWLTGPAPDRRLKARVRALFEEGRDRMYAVGAGGTMAWARDWMKSGRPAGKTPSSGTAE